MKHKVLWVLSVIPLLITAITIQFMNDAVPMHYDVAGNIDRWGSKYEEFLFPVLILCITFFWIGYLSYEKRKVSQATTEKRKTELQNNLKLLYIVAIGMIVMFSLMHYYFMYSALVAAGNNMTVSAFDLNVGTNILMGIFSIIIGMIIPKAKMGASVGIRTVWSMDNEKTWSESNRIGGIIMIITGILIILESILVQGMASVFVMIGLILGMAVVMVIYTYQIYKKYGNASKS